MINGAWEMGKSRNLKNVNIQGYVSTKEGVRNVRYKKQKAQEQLQRLAGVGKFRANKQEVTRGLWKEVARPSIMYGIEVIDWSAEKLEAIQNGVKRILLKANRNTGVEAIRGVMGWSMFEERLMKNTKTTF